jgi:hypothetical protein
MRCGRHVKIDGGAAGQSLVRNTKSTRELGAATMATTTASPPAVPVVDAEHAEREDAVPSHVFPLLRLPRELRDQVSISAATPLDPSLTAI